MSSKEKKISSIQLFKGLTLLKSLDELTSDDEKGLQFTAVFLADDDTLKKYRKDPEALNPYILQAEAMSPTEVAEAIAFFTKTVLEFSQTIQKGVQSEMEKFKKK